MEYSIDNVKNTARRTGRLILVVSGFFLGIAVCSFAAYSLVHWITNVPNPEVFGLPISLSAVGASVAFLVATAKQSLLSFREYYQYVVNGEKVDFYKESISILTSVFMLLLIYFSTQVLREKDGLGDGAIRGNQVTWDSLYLYKNEAPSRELAVFPIVFDNAKLGENEEFSDGVSILDHHDALITKLINALAPCASPASHFAVEIGVEGYASSRKFKDKEGNVIINSDELNAKAAYLRALNTIQSMEEKVTTRFPKHNFLFSDIDRNSYHTHRVPPYIDRSKLLADSSSQELLNRSAFIKLIKAGDCQRGEPKMYN